MMNTLKSKHLARQSLCALYMLAMMGCGPREEPPSTQPSEEMGGMDAGMDLSRPMEDMPGADMRDELDMAQDMSDAQLCEPQTQCPVDVCGDVPDGCGGMLECEPCACEAGTPSMSTCGVCGLGKTRCESETQVVCDEPPLELERLDCVTDVLYVDAAYQGFSSGNRSEPFTTLQDAVATSERSPSVRLIVLMQGRYEAEHVELPDGVSLLGGYQEGWAYAPDERSELIFNGKLDRFSYGLDVVDNSGFMLLAHLHVETTQAPEASVYTTPIQIRQSRNVNLFEVSTFAARGVPGQDGSDGANGLDGADGEDAQSMRPGGLPANFASPGQVTMTAGACQDTWGGNGGAGGIEGRGALDGEAPLNGVAQGGDKGNKAAGHPHGYDGQDGTSLAGMAPVSPAPTNGEGKWLPLGVDGVWIWGPNADGARGDDGVPGGGGTGGGGGVLDTIFRHNTSERYSGGSGGAGGNGGCAGEGGEGGKGGGSSFGLVVIDSPTTRLVSSSFRARAGGNGGAPGQGGKGGQGGNGGQGTPDPFENRGSQGGNGGAGQDGAEGAPGAGGYSVGALCQAPVIWEDSTGQGASPGRGGRAVTSNAEGATGLIAQQLGCIP